MSTTIINAAQTSYSGWSVCFTLYFMVVGTQDTSNKVSNGNVMPLSF